MASKRTQLLNTIAWIRDQLSPRGTGRSVPPGIELGLLAAIVLVGTVLRFLTIAQDPIWFDEGYTYAVARLPFSHLAHVHFDVHPPLFYILERMFGPEAGNELSLRLLPALASIAALVVVHLFARSLIGNVGALTVTALNATTFTLLIYANDARNNSLLLLFSILSFWTLISLSRHALKQHAKLSPTAAAWAIAYWVSSVFALYTHNIAVLFILTANGAAALAFSESFKAFWPNVLRLIAVNIPVVIAWSPAALRAVSGPDDFFWLEQTAALDAAIAVLKMAFPDQIGLVLRLFYAPILVLGAVVLLRNRKVALVTSASLLLAYPLLIWVFGHLHKPVFMDRTLLPVILGSTLLIGAWAAYAKRGIAAALGVAIALTASSVSSIQYLNRGLTDDFLDRRIRQDWRSAAHTAADEGGAILLCSAYPLPSVTFYRPGASTYIARPDGRIWPFTEAEWYGFLTTDMAVRNVDRGRFLTSVLEARYDEPVDPSELLSRHGSITLLDAVADPHPWCTQTAQEQFLAAGSTKSEIRYTGILALRFSQ